MLTDYFLDQIAEEYGNKRKEIKKDAKTALAKLQWTGNIRELRNVVERLVIMSNAEIQLEDVKKYVE